MLSEGDALGDEIETAWRKWAQFELSALSPADVRAKYKEMERLGLLAPRPHDPALDSMYERD